MASAQLLVILGVGVTTLLAVGALRPLGLTAAVVLVLAGLIVGFLPFVPDVSLEPDVALLGLLPLLVFDAAATSSPTAFFRNARPIGLLAVGLVVATAGVVAAVAHWVGHLSWAIAFVLGTAVGPTDAAAATSIARRLGLPRRLLTILEGEALFNDATALVLYAAAVTAVTTGHFSVLHTAGSVIYSCAAGIAIGLLVGWVGRRLRNRVDDPPIEIAGSILIAYAAYLPAAALHASGVLAAVSAGLYLGWHNSGGAFSARSRLQSAAFWQTLVFLINAALFVLVGLSFHTFTAHARGPVGRLLLTATIVVVAVIVTRLVWMEAAGWVARRRAPRSHQDDINEDGWRERTVLGWSGMRGAITLAALLAVPEMTRSGGPVAGRDDIIYLGFAVIIGTLVLQGMTLPFLVKRLRLTEHPSVADADRLARVHLTQTVLDYLESRAESAVAPAEFVEGLRTQYSARLQRLERTDDQDLVETPDVHGELVLRRDLIDRQRRALAELREQGTIGLGTARTIERELDLVEASLPSG